MITNVFEERTVVLDVSAPVIVRNSRSQVTAIVFATATEAYGRATASEQYFMHMCRYTGIPIVAWNADNSGLLPEEVRKGASKECQGAM